MLLIILSWFYILFIFFSLGLACNSCIEKIIKSDVKDLGNVPVLPVSFILIGGMIFCAVLASFISLIFPLSYLANLFFIILSFICLFLQKRRLKTYLAVYRKQLQSTHWILIVIFIAFVFVLAYLSAEQSSHFDDGLYYSTTIKWIEEYGIVKGIANINPRLGFNSTWHLLNALFGFYYLKLGNFNDLNGLLILIICSYSLGGLNKLIKRDYHIVNIVRSFFLIPLMAFHFGASSDFIFYNINYISSTSADIAVCILIWTTIIWIFELDFISSQIQFHRQSFYIILVSAFLFTVKPSSVPMLLTGIWFFVKYLKNRKFLEASAVVLTFIIVISPWLIRNVLISGYLVFPFSAIDVFHVDWKIPVNHVKWYENAVQVYAIGPGYDLNKPFLVPLSKWFPDWFGRLAFIQSVLFLASLLSIAVLVILFISNILKKGKTFLSAYSYRIFSFLIIIAGIIFWFFKGPDFRFGYGFIGILCTISSSLILKFFLENSVKYFGYFLLLSMCYILFIYYKPLWESIPNRLFKLPAERRMPDKISSVHAKNGTEIHIVEYGNSWYAPLPVANSSEYYTIMPIYRGKTIKDGFKPSIKPESK